MFKESLTNIFLKAIFIENGVRTNRNLNPIKLHIMVPVNTILGCKSLRQVQIEELAVLDYILQKGNIYGLLCEAYTNQNPIPGHNMIFLTIKMFIRLIKELKILNGYTFNLGFALNSSHTGISSFDKVLRKIHSSFDIVVCTHEVAYASQNEFESDVYIKKCIKLYQRKFPTIAIYKVQRDVDVTLI